MADEVEVDGGGVAGGGIDSHNQAQAGGGESVYDEVVGDDLQTDGTVQQIERLII